MSISVPSVSSSMPQCTFVATLVYGTRGCSTMHVSQKWWVMEFVTRSATSSLSLSMAATAAIKNLSHVEAAAKVAAVRALLLVSGAFQTAQLNWQAITFVMQSVTLSCTAGTVAIAALQCSRTHLVALDLGVALLVMLI